MRVCLELKTPSPPPPELEISFCPGKQRQLQYLNICRSLAGIFLRGCLTGSRQTEPPPTKQLRTKTTIVENPNEPPHTQWSGRITPPAPPQSDCSQPFFSLPGGSDGYRGAERLRGGRRRGGGSFCLAKFTKANIVHLFPVSNHESVLFYSDDVDRFFPLGQFQYFRC